MNRRHFIALTSASLLCLGAGDATALPDDVAEAPLPTNGPYIVFFHSVNCGACRILEPKLMTVLSDYGATAPPLYRFDLTFGDLGGRISERAETLGVAEVYARNGNATGYAVLMDGRNGNRITRISAGYSTEVIAELVRIALTYKS